MTIQEIHISHAQIAELEQHYTIRLGTDIFGDPISHDDFIAFVQQHPYVLPVLHDAPAVIASLFPNCPLYLSLEYDPEIAAFDHLRVYIATPLELRDLLDRRKRFYYVWGHDAVRRAHNKILFSAVTPGEMATE